MSPVKKIKKVKNPIKSIRHRDAQRTELQWFKFCGTLNFRGKATTF